MENGIVRANITCWSGVVKRPESCSRAGVMISLVVLSSWITSNTGQLKRYTYIHTCIHIYIYKHIYMTHTYIYIYIYIYIYTAAMASEMAMRSVAAPLLTSWWMRLSASNAAASAAVLVSSIWNVSFSAAVPIAKPFLKLSHGPRDVNKNTNKDTNAESEYHQARLE